MGLPLGASNCICLV